MTRKPAQLKARYDSKDEIVRDVVFILSAPVADATKAVVLRRAIRFWTESGGKHEGCRYWTSLARSEYLRRMVKPKRQRTKELCHEHVVPLKVIKQMLLALEPPTHDAVRHIFQNFVIAAIVHATEDAQLRRQFKSSIPPAFSDPASSGYHNPWLRYEVCGIGRLDCEAEPHLFEAFCRPRRRSSNG